LLDGKPFPYEKWLLRTGQETTTGQKLSPLLTRVLSNLTRLDGDIVQHSDLVSQAVYTLDTEAGDILEAALIAWGIDEQWIENAYGCLADVLFESAP